MNPKLILLLIIGLLGQITQAQILQLQPLATFGTNGNGSILPGQRPYLTDGTTNPISGSSGVHELQRSMAYNPTTGHLLILSRTNIDTGSSYYVAIIDATTGADVGSLALGTPGFGANAGFDFNSIAVANDGGIYICDLTSDSQTTGAFDLFYWANESSSQVQLYQGDPSNGNASSSGNSRWGDTLAVTGTGINTTVLVSSRGNTMAILTPTDPTLIQPWSATTLQTSVPGGNIGYGLAFGTSSNTIWAKTASGPLYLLSYNSAAGTATNLQTYSITVFPGWTGAIGIQSQSNLLAGLEMPPGLAANVRLYDVSNTTNPPVLLDRQAWVTNEDGNGIFAGSVIFGGTNVYALNSDNGIMAFGIFSGPQPLVPPAIILEPTNTFAYFQGAATFTSAADGIPAPAYQWRFNTNTVIVNSATFSGATNATLTVSNIAPANLGLYSLVATNSSGSVTSSPALLSQAVAFQNGQVYEPFNYTVGLPLQNLGGWVTNTPSVAAQVQGCYIAAGNLGVPGLAPPIGNHYLWASNVTVRLPFGTQTNGILYFSFALRATNPPVNTAEDSIAGFAYYSSTTLYPKIDLYFTDSSHYQIGVAKGSGNTMANTGTNATVFNATNIVFIVGCLVMTNGNSSSLDTVDLWVNPDPSTYGAPAPPTPSVANIGSGVADPASGVDRFSWRGISTSIQHEVDELRIGFTWAAVTPPPTAYLTASLSGNNVVVSWPTNAVGWTLLGTASLTGTPSWTAESPIVVQGTNNTYTVSNPTGQQFFQLAR